MIAVGLCITVLSFFITRWMMRVGIHDEPSHRSSHYVATPISGGVGVIAGFCVGVSYFMLSGALHHVTSQRLSIMSAALLLTIFVSLRDDMKALSASIKFLTQIVASILVVSAGFSLKTLPLPWVGFVPLGDLGGLICLLWIIFFTNVFNFMDGLNGLASGGSLCASFFSMLLALYLKETAFFVLSFSLFWSTLGFFFLNFPKGRIFLGDVGSQFLGLIWSVMLLIGGDVVHIHLSIYTVPLLFFSFIYDVSLTLARRLYYRKKVWIAHQTHLFQILHRTGLSHKQVTYIYMGFGILQGLGALILQKLPPTFHIFIFVPYLLLMICYTFWVQYRAQRFIKRYV